MPSATSRVYGFSVRKPIIACRKHQKLRGVPYDVYLGKQYTKLTEQEKRALLLGMVRIGKAFRDPRRGVFRTIREQSKFA